MGLLNDPLGLGIQHLEIWEENRGQHHATNAALKLARELGYRWIVRIDDDLTPKTKKWLKKLVERGDELSDLCDGDRFVLCPTILKLIYPIQPQGVLTVPCECEGKGCKICNHCGMVDAKTRLGYDVEIIHLEGGMRMHPVKLLDGYEAPVYSPIGRGDPQTIAAHVAGRGGALVRFRDIRIVHDTRKIVGEDSEYRSRARLMSLYWPFLEAKDV
jgi:glycosyltransferase involved in cell wall biosynthesis